jgi:hypothetical protein
VETEVKQVGDDGAFKSLFADFSIKMVMNAERNIRIFELRSPRGWAIISNE